MKVVLLKDVRDMGLKGSVTEVSDGHAVNFLIPRKMAVAATAKNIQEASLRQKQTDDRKAMNAELLKENITKLTGTRVTLTMKANETGHLYESVDAAAILAAAKEQVQADLPEEALVLEKPIKETGEFPLTVSAGGAKSEFTLVVEAA